MMFVRICAILLILPLPLIAEEKRPEPTIGVPDPLHLDPEWWSYFEVPEPELTQHIDATVGSLKALQATLDKDEDPDSISLIQRTILNLRALPIAKEQKAAPPPGPPVYHASYTLNDYLQIGLSERHAQATVDDDQRDIDRLSASAASAQRYIDSLFIEYLSKTGSTTEKLTLGLEIMAQRSALAITQESLRVANDRLNNDQIALDYLKKESQVASSHLDLTQYDPQQLNQDLTAAQNQLTALQNKAAQIEANAIGTFDDTSIGRSEHELLAQQAITAKAQVTAATLTQLYFEIQKYLYAYANGQLPVSEKEAQAQVNDWKTKQARARRSLSDWEEATMAEQERANSAYSRLLQDPANGDPQLQRLLSKRLLEVQQTLTALHVIDNDLYLNDLLIQQVEQTVLERSTLPERWWLTFSNRAKALRQRSGNWLDYPLFKIGGVPFTLLSILRIFVILFIAIVISRLVRSSLRRYGAKHDGSDLKATIYTLNKLIHYAIVILAIIVALASVGLNFSKLVIILGALSVGIGFGLQNIVNNFLSGLIILFGRNIRIGDIVELEDGQHARVVSIHIQNSILRTFDGVDVIVPNLELTTKRLVNWTRQDPYRRIRIPFGVAYGSDKELVRKVVVEAALRLPSTVKASRKYPAPQVRLVEFGESTLNFELLLWINLRTTQAYGSVKADYVWEIETALKEAHIEIPIPQRQIHITREEDQT